MSLERLWAGWRTAYVSSASASATAEAAAGCVLCRITAVGDIETGGDAERYVLWRGDTTVAVLNAFPYTSGHLMVVPTDHVGDLEEMSADSTRELWASVTLAVRAVKVAYQPGGLNVGLNLGRSSGAGIPGHLHVHVLPRWDGDTNFMTSIAEARVMPEALPDTWARLRAAWPS